MEYLDTIKLDNGKTIDRYINYLPNKEHWLKYGGKKECIEIEHK